VTGRDGKTYPATRPTSVFANVVTPAEIAREERIQARELARAETRELAAVTEAPTGRYRTIVIDPPWEGSDTGDHDPIGRGDPRYATMTIEELAALNVAKLAEPDDCHLYLWVTNWTLESMREPDPPLSR